eukprot:Nitzschia sp. Nitz4//NODE_293_length_29386_cov_71.949235//12793//14310//NITZ4_additional_000035-RA//-1//CDS//3329531827//6191//frame0
MMGVFSFSNSDSQPRPRPQRRLSLGFIGKPNTSNLPSTPPPVFTKSPDSTVVRKGVNPSRRASMTVLPSSTHSSSLMALQNSNPTLMRRLSSHSNTSSRRDASFKIASGEKIRSTSVASASSFVEEIIEEMSYDEEIIEFEEDDFDDYSYIEEIVEQPIYPDRETKVQFDEYDDVQTTLHIQDYSVSEISNSWYCRKDYDRMVDKAKQTVAKAETRERKEAKKAKKAKKAEKAKKKKDKDKKEESRASEVGEPDSSVVTTSPSKEEKESGEKKPIDTRGLEAWSTNGAAEIQALKERALEAVWEEQSRQWSSRGESDPEKMREVYFAVSASSQEVAAKRGEQDRADIEAWVGSSKKGKSKRNMLKKGKELLGKSLRVAKGKKSKKDDTKERKNAPKLERQTFRQPSRRMLEDIDVRSMDSHASGDDISVMTDNTKKQRSLFSALTMHKDDASSKGEGLGRRGNMSRLASWETGLSAGKH